MSQTLDFDAYRAATASDQVKIAGTAYPLRPASFNKTVEFSAAVDSLNLDNAGDLLQLTDRFAEITGVPKAAIDELTLQEIMELFRFFLARQLPSQDSPGQVAPAGPEPIVEPQATTPST